MILDISVKVKNHKCFDSIPQGFEKIYPINLIIGKNNSGKSTMLDLIEYVIKPNETFKQSGRQGESSNVIVSDIVTEDLFAKVFSELNNKEAYRHHIGDRYSYSLSTGGGKSLVEYSGNLKSSHVDRVIGFTKEPFANKRVLRVSAERDIKSEYASKEIKSVFDLRSDGVGATNLVRWFLNHTQFDPRLIRRDLLDQLNEIVRPDAQFTDIYTRESGDGNGKWEIYLEDSYNRLIALSDMGSGVRTIILVLLNMIVIPGNHKKSEYIYCFEELENNLHASWQRRLFNYISKYAKENNAIFFITTHSSVVIDLFSFSNTAQILHIQNNGNSSSVSTIISQAQGKSVLKDLEIKASDILLSNGVISVEGPSDAIYIELLLDLYKEKIYLKDNGKFNYSIQVLSTAIWKYAAFKDFDWTIINGDIENKIISLTAINHNHLVVLDKDDNYEDRKPGEWEQFKDGTGKNKARLIYESIKNAGQDEELLMDNWGNAKDGTLYFWVNDGTFETYLGYFINNKGKEEFEKYFGSHSTGYLEKLREGENSSISKVELAARIADFAINDGLTFNDFAPEDSPLCKKVTALYRTIKSWN